MNCDCGRKRGAMNNTNWLKHKECCKNKKIKLIHPACQNSNIDPIYSRKSKCVILGEYYIIIY